MPQSDEMTTPGLSGKTVIVTGAAGGVGRAVVDLLARSGARVIAEDISDAVHDLASDTVRALVGDVSDEATATRAVELAQAEFGGVDGLVNNAGRYLLKPIEQIGADEWDALMVTNVRGAFLHTRAAIGALTASRGAIVNVASIAGLRGFEDQVAYTSTKGALVQLTRSTAIELAGRGVRVNAVAPGAIDTGFMDDALKGADVPAVIAHIASLHPLQRISPPAEIAAPIAFLLSPGAASITGAILPVDGGYTAR